MPNGDRYFEFLGSIREPMRLRDFQGYARTLGLPEFRPPMTVSPAMSLLAGPISHRGECVGNLYLTEKEGGLEFTMEDEETLVMFASQAAMAIANARRHRDEQRARARLEEPGQHLTRGRGGLRREDRSAAFLQSGGGADHRDPAAARPFP